MSIVPAPLVQAPPYGLDSVVAWRDLAAIRSQDGITWLTDSCARSVALGLKACETAAPGDPALAAPEPTPTTWLENLEPLRVQSRMKCSAFGMFDAEMSEAARRHLVATEEAAVGARLWAAAAADAEPLDGGTTASEVFTALENLSPILGTILVSRGVAGQLIAKGQAETKGSRLFTRAGTPIVALAGTPALLGGATGVGSLIYIPGSIIGYRGDIETYADVIHDYSTNDRSAIAFRDYVLGLDACGPLLTATLSTY